MFNSYESVRPVRNADSQLPADPQDLRTTSLLDDNACMRFPSRSPVQEGQSDLSFKFRFTTAIQGLAVPVGTKSIPVPLINIGPVSTGSSGAQNVAQTYT
jgi:hypothetical protein